MKVEYRLLDANKNVMYQGTMRELAHYADVSSSGISKALHRGTMIKDTYSVDCIVVEDVKEEKPIKFVYTGWKEYVIPTYLKYGNAFVLRKPEIYVQKLKEMGYQVNIRECKDGIGYIIE